MASNVQLLIPKSPLNKTFQQKDEIINELKTLYWAEKQVFKLLPRFEKASTTRYLKACFKGHLQATTYHITRLEMVFELLNEKIKTKKCRLLESNIKEAVSGIAHTQKKSLVRELSLIESAKKIEEYEINKYNKLIKDLRAIKQLKIADFLEETLNEEREAEEVYSAVKEDVYKDEIFIVTDESVNEFEAAEEE